MTLRRKKIKVKEINIEGDEKGGKNISEEEDNTY